ncbi:lamin tail domain-containing protein [Cohnella herbarum]|uniref:Lamin tail domain-containing protein n=1 Tax=Cohnella herbarum TaxID=2728023 RepID=A0A7Z2VGX6_9BACL|nr:lamin tail domain-containing protein [Cohnella herbarum]QJD82842.1 lamin tail domain-containing protein [Cohnella herbarum]
MLGFAELHKKLGLIGTVATLTITLAACTPENANQEKYEDRAPLASVAVLEDEMRSEKPVERLNPSDRAPVLEKRELKWNVISSNDALNPCPCMYESMPIIGDLSVAPASLIGNHATVAFEEIEFGSFGEAKLYVVARDRYVGDTNKDENYEGFTYEAWLVALGDKIDIEGTRFASAVTVTGQSSMRDAYDKGKQLSKYAVLSEGNGDDILHSQSNKEDGVALISVDFTKQTAVLENQSDRDVDLTGWGLDGTNKREGYVFSEGTLLKAGGKLTIIAGLTERMSPRQGVILWDNNRFPWRYDGDQAVLRNADEEVVSHVERPNLTEPVIIGVYKNMPITEKITSNPDVTSAIIAIRTAGGTSMDKLRINEVDQAKASNGRTIWMLKLRPEGQNEGAFVDVRIDPDNGELLMVSGIGEAENQALDYEDAGALEKLANDQLRLLLGDAHAEYKLIDFVEKHGYAEMTVARGNQDIYLLVYSETEGFKSVARPWLYGLQ